ncbi:hypothetical protein GN956_G1561 [Arapaima gigas]
MQDQLSRRSSRTWRLQTGQESYRHQLRGLQQATGLVQGFLAVKVVIAALSSRNQVFLTSKWDKSQAPSGMFKMPCSHK